MKNQKNNQPLISIVMPVYNAGDFLVEAIESIINQTYKNWELIAVDDASSDNSWKIIKQYSKKDHRIKAFKNKKNLGIANTINKALYKAKGNFIARMDADDIALPDRLEKQINFLIKNKDIGVVGSQMFEIDEKNIITNIRKVPLTDENIKKNLFITQTIQNPTLMINKKSLPKKIFNYDQRFSPVDDLDFLFKLVNYTKFANLPNYLMAYRKHLNNSSLKNIKKTFFLTLKVRLKAIFKYGYKPTLLNLFINLIQILIIFILPKKIIYALFKLFKGHNLYNKKIKIDNFLIKKTNKKINLSLVLPVFKAEKFISKNIKLLDEFLKNQKIKYEIIAVVDGNIDKSFEILSKIKNNYPNLKIFSFKNNRGKGNAVRYGINKAKYSYIGYIDSGFDIDYSSLEFLINNIKNYKNLKVWIASKYHPMSILENIPLTRKIYSFFFKKLVNLMVNTGNIDTQVGLKIFKKEVIKKIINKLPLKINGFAFDVELIKEIIRRKYNICQTPVTIIKEKQSTVTLKNIIRMFFDIIKLSYFYKIRRNQLNLINLLKTITKIKIKKPKYSFYPNIINMFL